MNIYTILGIVSIVIFIIGIILFTVGYFKDKSEKTAAAALTPPGVPTTTGKKLMISGYILMPIGAILAIVFFVIGHEKSATPARATKIKKNVTPYIMDHGDGPDYDARYRQRLARN